jgi:hypothetical protein
MDFNVLVQRVRRVFSLDATVFEEVRLDRTATVQAVIVAVGSILVFAIGGWLWYVINSGDFLNDYAPSSGDVLIRSTLIGTILASALWFGWIGITYVMLTQLFHARADVNELVRVMGFAAAPLAFGVLMFLPLGLDFAIGLTAIALMFGSTLLAVQTATDAGAGKVLASVAAGFFIWALILTLFVGDDNFYAPGFFIFDYGSEVLRR